MVRTLLPVLLLALLLISFPLPHTTGSALHAAEKGKKPVRIFTDPETADLLKAMGKPLILAAGLSPERVQFHVMLNDTLNAFALPNQHIVFHSGLLLAAQERDEVAAVMAHELAHLAAGHHIQLKGAAKGASVQSLIIMAAGIAAGLVTGEGGISQAAMMGGQASGVSRLLEIRREKEQQSDRLAIHYLAKTGYDPKGMAQFLKQIQRQQRLVKMPPPYLLSHPTSSKRVAKAREMASHAVRQKPRHTLVTENQLERVKIKLQTGTTETPHDLTGYYRRQLRDRFLSPSERELMRYGLALSLRYAGQVKESLDLLNRLLKKRPDDIYLIRERGMAHLELGAYKKAEADFLKALKQKPEHEDLNYRLAFVHNEQGRYLTASRRLRRLVASHPKSARYLYLLGVVEGRQKRMGPSHLALARYYRLSMDKKNARWHFDQAIRLYPPDAPERALAQAERKQLDGKVDEKPKKPARNSRPQRVNP